MQREIPSFRPIYFFMPRRNVSSTFPSFHSLSLLFLASLSRFFTCLMPKSWCCKILDHKIGANTNSPIMFTFVTLHRNAHENGHSPETERKNTYISTNDEEIRVYLFCRNFLKSFWIILLFHAMQQFDLYSVINELTHLIHLRCTARMSRYLSWNSYFVLSADRLPTNSINYS